ncbi:WxcM-like domain-containing protein [Candidatus Daviesbacteria bacterium]|nr:WxcM-like domain-containing protein [Candidatus Daviesbacteria bacterium]
MPIKVIKNKPEFTDERGYITRLIDQDKYPLRAVLYIVSKKGSTRGNHYHKTDAHFVYCLSGKFRYSEKDMSKKNSKRESVILKPGDLVLSRPMVAHAMEFLEDSVFLAFTTEPREQDKYEGDLVRLKLV